MLFLDWKTIVKARDPRIDELAQIAAYQGREMLGSLAADVYVSQETMRVVRVEPWSKEQLEFGWDYFTTAYKIMQMNDRFNEDVRR
jgi:hypothetical protein